MASFRTMNDPNASPALSKPRKKRSLPVKLGDRIKELRKARGWSQRELAARSGVSSAQLSKYENGTYLVTLGALIRISRAFGLPVDTLLPDMGDMPRDPGDVQLLLRFRSVIALGTEEKAVACGLLDTVLAMRTLREAGKDR
jgi:HTH-type transcriptional regulator / antitoxin HipB